MEKMGRRVTVAGERQTSRRSRTTQCPLQIFLTIEYLQGALDVIPFLFDDIGCGMDLDDIPQRAVKSGGEKQYFLGKVKEMA
jgi:hypothetical protein